MVWPIWVAMAALFSVFAFLTKQRARAETLALILIGLAFVQISKQIFEGSSLWVAACMVWLVVAALVISIRKTVSFEIITIAALLIISALCIPIGRIAGETYAFGSVALFFSDLFGASALFYLGGASVVTAIRDGFRGDRGLGDSPRVGLLGRNISGGEE